MPSFASGDASATYPQSAGEISAVHHSYLTAVPEINLVHHGLFYQSALVGAIIYRYPLLHKKAIHYDATGQLLPELINIDECHGSASRAG